MKIRQFVDNLSIQKAIAEMIVSIVDRTEEQLSEKSPSTIVTQASPEVLEAVETWAPYNGYVVDLREATSIHLSY